MEHFVSSGAKEQLVKTMAKTLDKKTSLAWLSTNFDRSLDKKDLTDLAWNDHLICGYVHQSC